MSVELLIILMTAAACAVITVAALAVIKALEVIVRAIRHRKGKEKRKRY